MLRNNCLGVLCNWNVYVIWVENITLQTFQNTFNPFKRLSVSVWIIAPAQACEWVCMCTCVCVCVCVCWELMCMCVHVCVVHVCVVHVCAVYVGTHTYIHAHTHTHSHADKHTHTHTHTHTHLSPWQVFGGLTGSSTITRPGPAPRPLFSLKGCGIDPSTDPYLRPGINTPAHQQRPAGPS